MTIGSMPICLLNKVLPIREISFTKSESKSGTFKSLFMIFFRIEIKSVGNEELFVMSELGSSDLPLIKILASTFKAD